MSGSPASARPVVAASVPGVRSGAIVTVVCALTLAAWAMASDTGAILVKWALDPLAHSTSNAGSVLLLLAVAAGGALLIARRVEAWTVTRIRSQALALVAVIAIGQVAALGGQIALMRHLTLPATLPIYYWQGEHNTYSFLLHTHVGKLALRALGSLPALDNRAYDVGEGLAGALPGSFGFVIALCLAASIMLAARLLPPLTARAAGIPALPWLYGVAVFNCIKTIADGGPLTYRFLPAFLALLWVTGLLRGRRWGAVALVGLVASGVTWGAVSAADAWRAAGAGLMFVTLLLPLALRPSTRQSRLIVAACISVASMGYVAHWRSGPAVLLGPLPAGSALVVADLHTLRLRSYPATGLSGVEAYRRHGDDPLKPRRVFVRLPDAATGAGLPVFLQAIDAAPAASPRRSPLRIEAARPVRDVPGGALLEIAADPRLPAPLADAASALTQNNYYCFLHLLAATLRAQGLSEFVLAPTTGHAVREFLSGRVQ